MATAILMPKLGLTMTEGTIEEWKKKEGDEVKKGEILFSVATDKLTNDIEAEEDGILLKILVKDGDDAPCKEVIGWLGAAGESVPEAAPAAEKAEAPAEAAAPKAEEKAPAAGTVLVIGAGPGGYVAAIRAAQLGAKVTLFEKAEVGGTCLNRGCIPTKAMLHTSEIYAKATGSTDIGIVGNDVSVDWEKVQAYRASVVEKLTSGVKALCKANKIKVVAGEASFVGPKTVKANGETYTADKIIIAAGSYPIIPGIPGVKGNKACIDSTACLSLDHIPESLVVIGAGVVGLELGTVYSRYGAKVTVVEKMPGILPGMDSELTGMLLAKLRKDGLDILTSAEVKSVEETEKGALVKVGTEEGEKEFEAEKVLVCVGRGADSAALGLEAAGIKADKGFIQVNDRLETNVPGVYAIGDITGKMMYAHAAIAMGEIAAENAMGLCRTFDTSSSPSCAYIGPEIAGIGFTEDKAKELGLDYKIGKFPTSANGRSLAVGETDGLVKVLVGSRYGEILGVHMLASGATEIIEEAALAIKLEATADEIIGTIHCHPTVSEALSECVMAAEGRAIHIPNKKK